MCDSFRMILSDWYFFSTYYSVITIRMSFPMDFAEMHAIHRADKQLIDFIIRILSFIEVDFLLRNLDRRLITIAEKQIVSKMHRNVFKVRKVTCDFIQLMDKSIFNEYNNADISPFGT